MTKGGATPIFHTLQSWNSSNSNAYRILGHRQSLSPRRRGRGRRKSGCVRL